MSKGLLIVVVFFQMLFAASHAAGGDDQQKVYTADVCVYGGTASGVAAALAAARRGQSVIIIEPMRFLGGIPGGGISINWDCLYRKDIGGIAKELHDADDLNQWKVRQMLKKKVEAAGIRYFTEHRLDEKSDVVMNGNSIKQIHLNYAPIMDEGVPPAQPQVKHAFAVRAKVFIDAGYEGDLLAFSGATYTVGRESESHYNESLAGQRGLRVFNVDPYVEKGNPDSGLLPMISSEPYEPGAASRYYMGYNFRLKGMGPHSGNRTLIKPLGREVDRGKYALTLRAMKDAPKAVRWPFWNYARKYMISGGIPGRQSDYADGNWAVRSAVWREFIDHVKTMNTIIKMKNPSTLAGHYPMNNDFPDQLYIRLGRRMVSDYVMTQHDLMHQTETNDSVGLGYYGVDLYPARLLVHKGKVASEGNTFMRVSPGPYQISYRSLIPKKGEVDNLVVSVCMSASHVAMASIRMESTYVIMGEAAGVVASHAVESDKKVQDLQFDKVKFDMESVGIVTRWDGEGYGPDAEKHWSEKDVYWYHSPEEYKLPVRMDKSWAKDPRTIKSGIQFVTE